MSATRMKDLPPRLQDRYGYRRTPIVAIVIAAVLALLIAGLGGWMAYRVANPEVRYRLFAWDAVSPDHTSITFEVNKGPAPPWIVCCGFKTKRIRISVMPLWRFRRAANTAKRLMRLRLED